MATNWIADKGKFAKNFAKAAGANEKTRSNVASHEVSDSEYDSDGSCTDGSLRDDIGDLLRLADAGIMEFDDQELKELRAEYTKPKRTAKKRPSSDPAPVKLAKNRFVIPESAEKSDEPEPTKDPEPPKCRLPPIMITEKKTPWAEIVKHLNEVLKDFFSADHRNGKYKLITTTTDDFRSASKLLKDKKYEFHTFSMKEERVFKYVIRGLPSETSTDDIAAELKDLGMPIKTVIQMKSGRESRPIPLFLVHQYAKKCPKSPYMIDHLFHLQIRVEKYRNASRILQCFQCQGFHHSSRSCGHAPRCVKCGGEHRSSECTKPREEEPTCANCNGKHTANFKGCEKYPKPRLQPVKELPQRWARNSTVPATDFPPLPAQNKPPTAWNQPPATNSEEKIEKLMESLEKMLTQISSLAESLSKIAATLMEKTVSESKN